MEIEEETREVICIENGHEKNAKLKLIEGMPDVSIEFSSGELVIKKTGETFFETLILLREVLEKSNIKLLCKGCCKNVYPSAMILSMGAGRRAYTLTLGKQAKMNSLVDIFDSCSIDEYATIKEQLQYYEEWDRSF